MIKFFKRLRYQLLGEGKTGKYLKYAIGEIVLVVIGILIALSINNWNEANKLIKREKSLLTELRTNLETNVINLENDIVSQVKSAATIQYLLNHLDNRKPYTDSLDYFFAEADLAPDVVLTSSAFETLKSIGFELIKKDSLRKEILYLFEVTYPTLIQNTKRIEDQVWTTASVPMYQKHFRREIEGRNHPINYNALINDKEFTNMLSFRVSMRKGSTANKKEVVNETKQLIEFIENELIKQKR